ncbi:winged helix-turn-helix domain-containing protein [Streptomyces sp. AK02-01A]|uniref:winged helix-turn-helix domain-containing protein n=1 Tax=Streptomyces sp. AK02-01A TaxID=3028648 RepID=UPI0029B5631D|nr:winged helix-turn-helix domain-containing protein [Streptomyces sp. AK02-01A]MDX3849443.1 winged helix-turn-helix domain-containing protein [Streptomyces sp. AK02-01A]
MLRIYFTSEDLNVLRVAARPDPLWEIVLSLHLLQNRQAALVFDPWRREVRAAIARAGLTSTVAALNRLCPWAHYFPDFLTPGQGVRELETGLDQVLSTPAARLGEEISLTFGGGPLPPGARRLAEGDPRALEGLGDALRRYYAVAVEPYGDEIRAAVAADRPVRAAAALDGGPDGLLASYQPELVRRDGTLGRDGVLEAAYPVDDELVLGGRPLTMIPAFFCVRYPVKLADSELPPVLVHPLAPAPGWLERARSARGRDGADGTAAAGPAQAPPLARLIGHTRAAALDILDRPLTTSQLGTRLRLTLSTASRHATVLREAGLIASERRGNAVVHSRTALGEALLDGRVRE